MSLLLLLAAQALPLSEFARPGPSAPDAWPAPEQAKSYVASAQIEARVPEEMQWAFDDTPSDLYQKVVFRADLCVFGSARKYALSSAEPAATIAEAAIGNCVSWNPALTSAAFSMIGSLELAEETTSDYTSIRRQKVIGHVIEWRSSPSKDKN